MMGQQGGMSLERLCGLGRVARASYYRYWKRRAPAEAGGELRDRVQRICLAHRAYGYRRVRAALRQQGLAVNHKKIRRLMREDNLLAVRRQKWITTTDSHHLLEVFPNLARFLQPDGADQLWVADRGVQYASLEYVSVLQQHRMIGSMSRTAYPYDNARCESFLKTLKQEEIHCRRYRTLEQLRGHLEQFIEHYYNQQRLHSALNYRSPAAFEAGEVA